MGVTPPTLLWRRGLLVVAAAAAVTGVLGGLTRLGFVLGWGPAYAPEHGPLLVLGVFAPIIALERAVALGKGYGMLAPTLGVAGAVAMLLGLHLGVWLSVGATLALVVSNAAIVRRQSALFTWLMLLGAGVLAVSAVTWALGVPVYRQVLPWTAFFILTIAAERLELSRLAPTPRWAPPVLAVQSVLLAGLAMGAIWVPALSHAVGAVLALIGAWQLRFDLARRTVRRGGLPAFSATGVLAGALWLLVCGGLLIAAPLPPSGPRYDAVLHTVFVGYVLSMVFAHAPIILPAVARVELPFSRWLYLPLGLLHAGLVLRLVGDLALHFELRRAGGIVNALSLILFPLVVGAVRRSRRVGARHRQHPHLGRPGVSQR